MSRLSRSDVYTSTTPPSNPSNGKLWYNPSDNRGVTTTAGTPLRAFMQPSSLSLYPPSDFTSITNQTTAPVYTSQYNILFNDANATKRWRFSGSWYNFSGNGLNSINGATPSDPASWSSCEIEFYVNGTDFAIWCVTSGTQSDYRIYVDDMPLTPDWQLSNSTAYQTQYIVIKFPTSRIRRVRLMWSGLLTFTGLTMPGATDVWAAPKRFRAAIIGDSYVQGGHNAGASEAYLQAAGLPNQIALLTGWEVLNMGQGSTGYINNASNAGGKDFYGSTSRMNALAALPVLDLIIVYGSGNDSSYSSSALTAAANSLWNAIKTQRPSTPIVVAGMEPGTLSAFNDSLMDASNTALKSAAASNANVAGFIDMRNAADSWMIGTGHAGSPNDTGNADFFISSDAVHPTRAGYFNMAWKMVQELGKIKV